MVRAIQAGTKTQTRRIVKPQPERRHIEQVGSMLGFKKRHGDGFWLWPNAKERILAECPYGQPGDRLWVRETWAGPLVPAGQWEESDSPAEFERPEFCRYAADGGPAPEFLDADEIMRQRWTPSIHMPRWASRITLEITGVRVERLQDISEADAIAEGIERKEDGIGWKRGPISGDVPNTATRTASPRLAYQSLWEQINGPSSWAANPWVWVIEFRRTKP